MQEEWQRRIEAARRLGRPGDIMLLAGEAPSPALRAEALRLVEAPVAAVEPRQVILFAGHMIDRPDRATPRFPPDRVPAAAAAIDAVLARLDAASDDLALCSGANGGDLLFGEACVRRGLSLELRLPQEESKFLDDSVTFAGDQWRDRFYTVKAHPRTKTYVMPDELGPGPPGTNVYARVNLWQLYTAMAWGDEKLRFICLWDGKPGDGPGGTQHMVEVAGARTRHVYQIDPATGKWEMVDGKRRLGD